MPRTQSLSRPGGQLEFTEGVPRSLLVWGLDKKAWTREKDVIDEHGDRGWCWLREPIPMHQLTLHSPVLRTCWHGCAEGSLHDV